MFCDVCRNKDGKIIKLVGHSIRTMNSCDRNTYNSRNYKITFQDGDEKRILESDFLIAY